MPIEILAGESFVFDVVVHVGNPGDSEMDFNLFVESEDHLYIEPIKYPLVVVDSGRSQPDWIKPVEEIAGAPKATDDDQSPVSSNGETNLAKSLNAK